jgi:hypothetical protein
MKYFLAICVFMAISLSTAVLTEGMISEFGRGSLSASLGSTGLWLTLLYFERNKNVKQ